MRKATITGLTEATLTFNTLNILLHGEEVASNIVITSPEQEFEIISMVNAGFIKVEIQDGECVRASVQEVEKSIEADAAAKEETKEETKEDKPKKRGRPKGSKNKRSAKKEGSKKPKQVARKTTSNDEEPESDAVVMTPDGAKTGKTRKASDADQEEVTDATRESIETMDRLEEEEKEELAKAFSDDKGIDEDSLDPSERMGQDVVVSTGKEASKKKLTRSAVPDSEIAQNRDPFIDREAGSDDKIEDAFIDDAPDASDDTDDSIIEL